ncbi:MAG: hypothetical protein NTY77_02965 [Elusimicrobia bacterium]|nr:hypothetical protein [Elusimicrobiota bacterium]
MPRQPHEGSRPALLPIAALTVLGLGFFQALWLGRGIVYSPRSDIIAYLVGTKSVFQKALSEEGSLALWNPAVNCGTPAFAAPAAMATFPTHWFYLFLPVARATNLMILATVLAAGLAMYLLTLRLFHESSVAFFCAAGYMFCHRCLQMIDAGWFAVLSLYALTPLLFWSLDRLLERPGGRRIAASAAVFALCLMTGYAQGAYYLILASALFAACRLRPMAGAARWRALGSLAAAGAIGLLIAAPDLLPRLEFVSLSTRLNFDPSFAVRGMPTWSDIGTLLDPYRSSGPEGWERSLYFGLWLLPACVLAFWKDGRRSLAFAAVCLALPVFCFDGPALRLAYAVVPGFKLFRLHSRLLLLEQFALVVLAGRGLMTLCASDGGRSRRGFGLTCGAAALLGFGFAAAWKSGSLAVSAGGLALAAALALTPALPGPALVASLGMLPLLDNAWRMIPVAVPLADIFPQQAFYAPLRRAAGHGRVAAIGRRAIPYGAAGYLGIDMANGYEPLNLKHFQDYFSVLKYGDARRAPRWPVVWTDLESIAKPDLLRALDIEAIVANGPVALEGIGYAPAGESQGVPVFDFYQGMTRLPVRVWRDTRPLGPAYFATAVRRVAGDTESLAAVAASGSAREAYVADLPPQDLELSGGVARLARRGYDRYWYDVDSRGRNFLILSQIWYPGWRAWLDGRETPLYRTNHALVGCLMPPGRHTLRLELTAPRLRLGLALASLGAAGVALLAW